MAVYTKEFLTNVTWILSVAGATLSIVGYVRSGTYSTEYPFDLALMYAGLVLVLGGFVGYGILLRSSRSKPLNPNLPDNLESQ